MTSVKIAELKDNLSRYLRAVEAGAEIEVTDRNRPIARIVPARHPRATTVARPLKSFTEMAKRQYPPAHWAISSTELLMEERGER